MMNNAGARRSLTSRDNWAGDRRIDENSSTPVSDRADDELMSAQYVSLIVPVFRATLRGAN